MTTNRVRVILGLLAQYIIIILPVAVAMKALFPHSPAAGPKANLEGFAPDALMRELVSGSIAWMALDAVTVFLSVIAAMAIAPKAPRWIWLIFPGICAAILGLAMVSEGLPRDGQLNIISNLTLFHAGAIIVSMAAAYFLMALAKRKAAKEMAPVK